MRYLLALLFVASSLGSTYNCTGSDAAGLQSALNAGGTTTIVGACDIGTTSIFDTMDGTTLTATAGSGASITYHTSGFNQGAYAMYINNNTITVSNITWNGGGFSTTNSSHTTPQHDVTITNNIIQNIVSGTNGIDASGLWLRFNISSNQFLTISSVPVGSINNGTNVENGGGGYVCNYPTAGANQCAGGGINQGNGVDQTTIANNLFDVMLGDGMHLGFNWMLSSNSGDYVTSTNNIIANNTFTRGHRINIEMQGDTGSGCPGGCDYGRGYASFSGWQIKGNTAYNYIGSYGDTYFLSIPVGTIGMVVINNTGIMNDASCASECAGYAAEIAGTSGVYQGNSFTRSTASTDWSAYFMVGSNFTAGGGGGIVTLQNNYLRAANTGNFYECESTSFPCPGNGTIVNQYNNATTSVVANPLTNTISSGFSTTNPVVSCTANGASFPSGGNASWCTQATDQLSIRNVIFYLDGSTTPYASGIELQDLNTNFASTGQWLYHITINTSTLSNGSHTIKETTTDGGQTQNSATQSFTVGSTPGTINCTGSGDATAIQASLNGGGTTTLVGSCNIGSTTLNTSADHSTLTTSTGASITYSGGSFALNDNNNYTTITNITWIGGGILTTQTSLFTPQIGGTYTGDTFQNITSNGANAVGIFGNGYWSFFTVSYNTFYNITTVPWGSVNGSTNVENGYGGYDCNYPFANANGCYGSGIYNVNGLDNTIVEHNSFNQILGNAMSLKFSWTEGSTPGAFTSAANNSFSYNKGTNIHRMFEETGGVGSCPGPTSCNYNQAVNVTNWKLAGNFSTFYAPYGQTYGLSIPQKAMAPQVINNTFSITQAGDPGFAYEEGNVNELFQGNVASVNTGLTTWAGQNISATVSPGQFIYQQNNIFFGPPGTLAGLYYGPEGTDYGGTFVNRYNVNGGNCTNGSNCAASTMSTAFITSGSPSAGCTANGASFPTGGNGTWCFYVTNQISIMNVQFFLDGSSTPIVTQEIQDLSSTFSSDSRWQYHATINTSTLSGGSHTILAKATDVSGATSSQSQTFSTGSGPGVSFSPTTLAFGTISLGSSSSPQATTLTNTGTTTLTISNAPITTASAITGTNAGDFAITATTCSSTLAASATCTITVVFTPVALGSRVAFISITDNASGSPHTVQLTGGASLCQAGNIVSNCNLGTGALSPWAANTGSYGSVSVDNTGPGGTFAAHITATAPVAPGSNLEFYQDGLTFPANGTMMQLTGDCYATRSQLVNVLGILSVSPFTSYGLSWMEAFPTSYGTHPNCKSPFFKVQGSPTSGSGRLTYQTDNETTGDQFFITNVNLLTAGSVPASQLSASSVSFTSQAVGTTQTGTPITVTNGGVANLTISSIAYVANNTGDFSYTTTCGTLPATVTPSSTCTITPTFTPTTTGTRISNLVITTNDTSTTPQSLPASGVGIGGSTEILSIEALTVSHGSVYFDFTTQTNSTNVRTRYGTTSCAGGTGGTVQTNLIAGSVPASFSSLSIGGLTSNTTYHICAEVSKNGGTTWTSGGPELVVTTAVLPNPHPALPIAPLTVDTAYPNTTGYGVQNVSTDSGFSAAYATACTNWASAGQIINLAPGTLLHTGPYAFTCTPPDVHTIAVSDITLPSTINWSSHGFAENDLVSFGRTYAGNVTYPAGGGCNVGYGTVQTGGIQSGQRYQVHVLDSNTIQIRCLPQVRVDPAVSAPVPPIMAWTALPVYTGTGKTMLAVPYHSTGTDANGNPIWERRLPSGATTPPMIIQATGTLPPEHTQVTPPWAPSLFIFQDPVANISSGALQHPFIVFGNVDPNTEVPTGPYRIVGAEITTDNYNPNSSDPLFWSTLIYTHAWDDQIIFDRCYYHIPDGNREYIGLEWEGSNQAWVDSYHDNLWYATSGNTGLTTGTTGLTLAQSGSNSFTITAGTAHIPNLTSYTLSSTETVSLTGTSSGRVRAYFDLTSSGAFTVATPSGITASCSPATCTNPTNSAAGVGTCPGDTYADFPTYGTGESSAALIGCADLTSGSITAAGVSTTNVSDFNSTQLDTHMIGGIGPGPYAFIHNYADGCGITWHFDDSGGYAYRGNYTWNRNYIRENLKFLFGHVPDSLNLFCGNRQPLEWKGGHYIQAKGNVFDGVWRELIPDSGFFAIQPLVGGIVSDVDFTSNTLKHGSAILQGPTNTCNNVPCPFSSRIHLNNTLTQDINGFLYTANGTGINNAGEGWGNQFQNVEDALIEHQTDGTASLGKTPWILSNTSMAVEGYSDIFSIHWFNGVPSQITSLYGDSTGQATGVPPGCSSLSNYALMNCQFTPTYSFQNLMLGGYTDTSIPSGQSTVSTMTTAFGSNPNSYLATGTVAGTTNAVGWRNPTTSSNANYCLSATSSYNAGSGIFGQRSADAGINCDKLDVDQGKLVMLGTPSRYITTSGFTVAYRAPDSANCYVGTSTTNNVTTATWVTDAGGNRERAVAKTGLSTQTEYFGWVYCQGNSVISQASFQVKTH